ncbi:MAG: TadE/TadG family type IV pilus assembly protein [Anaerolineales bacterium]
MRRLQRWQTVLRKTFTREPGRGKSRGQSLVELALFLPILLILLSGLVELGFALNRYVNVVESVREGARYGVDQDPATRDLVSGVSNMTCASTLDFYAKVACVIQQTAAPITLDAAKDEIIITVARVYRDPRCDSNQTATPPAPANCNAAILPDPQGMWPSPSNDPAPGEVAGQWRLFGNGSSRFTRSTLQTYINANTVSNGVLVVEVYFWNPMVLKLPWITPFIPDPFPFYTYAIVPLPAGEPRPTPTNTPTPTPTPTYTPTPPPLNCSAFGTSGVRQEVWYGLPGDTVADVISGTNSFANAPNTVDLRNSFSLTTNLTDTYGSRWRAQVCIPTNGTYYFWIDSRAASELLLNTTTITNPGTANWTTLAGSAVTIATVASPGSAGACTWNAAQRSAPIALNQGFYYLEARHKDDTGADHLAVAMTTSTTTPPGCAVSVPPGIIPASRLFPPAALATATPTPTFTPSPTPTPTLPPCLVNVVDVTRSRILVSNSPQWSDNFSTMQVQAQLLDNCNGAISDGRTVTLTSSRPTSDTITLNTVVGNIYYFDVRSTTVGTSTFTASVNRDGPGVGPIVVFPVPAANNTGDFTCVTGAPDVSTNPNSLQILYTNPSSPSLNRRLWTLTVTWPSSSGRQLNTVSFGNSANIIWNGPPANPPTLNIGSGNWTSINRSIVTGTFRPLQINFNGPITPGSGSWTFSVTAAWDDGFGNSVCQSPSVIVTLP